MNGSAVLTVVSSVSCVTVAADREAGSEHCDSPALTRILRCFYTHLQKPREPEMVNMVSEYVALSKRRLLLPIKNKTNTKAAK